MTDAEPKCVNAHDRCFEGGPCPLCEARPRRTQAAERIKALEVRVAELERRLSGGAAAGAAVATGTIYSIPDGCYFENGKAMYGGRGGGGQG